MTAPFRAALLLLAALLARDTAAASDVVFSYDKNGNLTGQTVEGVTTEYLYDVQNRLTEVRRDANILVRFQYDGEDRIVKRIGAQGIRQYVYDGERVQAEFDEDGVLVASYSWAREQLLSISRPGQATLFPQHDGLGSIVALGDLEGNVVARYHYDAWGALRFPEELTADPNRFGFTGHRWDEEIGLVSAPARRFDPLLGRFTTQDRYLGEAENPFSIHRYLYGNANPTRFTDPTGHWSWQGIWEGIQGVPRAVAEPALWVYDTTLVAGARAFGISPDHVELQSALGRRQQQRIEQGQSGAVAATKGAVETPLAVFSLGTTAVAQGHYELYQSYSKGEITIDEYDRQLSRMAGGQIGAAALGSGVSRATGRTWMGRMHDAARSSTASVVGEGNSGDGVLVPVDRPPASVADPVPPALPRVAGGSQGADAALVQGPGSTGLGRHGVNLLEPKTLQAAPEGVRFGSPRGGGGSAADQAYAAQVSGGAEKSVYVNNVELDAVRGGVLIDAKRASGSGSFYDISGTDSFTQNVKIPKILGQAQRQVDAAQARGFGKVRWEVADPTVAQQLQSLFVERGIQIQVIHTAPR